MARTRGLRRHERVAQSVPVQLNWKDPRGTEGFTTGTCVDISPAGMRVIVPVRIDEGVYVSFRAEKLPLQGSASVRACARKGAKYIIGLEFSGGLKWQPKPPNSDAS